MNRALNVNYGEAGMKIRWGVMIRALLVGTAASAQGQVQDPAESKEVNTQA